MVFCLNRDTTGTRPKIPGLFQLFQGQLAAMSSWHYHIVTNSNSEEWREIAQEHQLRLAATHHAYTSYHHRASWDTWPKGQPIILSLTPTHYIHPPTIPPQNVSQAGTICSSGAESLYPNCRSCSIYTTRSRSWRVGLCVS